MCPANTLWCSLLEINLKKTKRIESIQNVCSDPSNNYRVLIYEYKHNCHTTWKASRI